MNDNEIIQKIIQGGSHMEKCLENFYKENIRFINVMEKKYGLSREAAIDAYSDAIIDFKEQVRNRQFQQKSKCSTYLYSIFNNKCIDILRKKTTHTIMSDLPENMKDQSPDIVQMLTLTVEKKYLDNLMTMLGSRCREILMDWNDGYSMEEIAERNALLNANVARSKRYTCLQQLLALAGKSRPADFE
jgi:RNA polymerase sigma-70 factor (ECF subfamily)